jgi:hypothetical protein
LVLKYHCQKKKLTEFSDNYCILTTYYISFSLSLSLFLVLLGFELRVSHLLGRCFTIWIRPLALFALVILGIGSHILDLGLNLDHYSLTDASCAAGITVMYHHIQLVGWYGDFNNFLSELASSQFLAPKKLVSPCNIYCK